MSTRKRQAWRMTLVLLCVWTCSAAGSAWAAPDKCQAELGKRSALFHAKVAAALQRCGDAIRREQAKNVVKAGSGFLAVAAHLCQREFNRIFDFPNVLGGKSERQKFFDAIDNAFTAGATPKCTVADLEWQGLVHSSGSGAVVPTSLGANAWDFAKVWLAVTQVQRALDGQLAVQADFLARLQELASAPAKPPGTSVATAATNCTLPPSCDPRTVLGCRPDLCRFRPPCLRQGCGLAASSAVRLVQTGANESYPVAGVLPLSVCPLAGWGYPFGNNAEGILLAGTSTRMLAPVAIPGTSTTTLAGSTVCADVVRAMGYCGCTVPFTGGPLDFAVCRDHVAGSGASCSGAAVAGPVAADAVHQNTTNGPLSLQGSNATVDNDCVLWATVRLTVVANGNEGADDAPCTSDDFAPTVVLASVPFTTGEVSATIADAPAPAGGCSASIIACVEDANCPSGQTCSNPAPTLSTLNAPTLTGAAASGPCAAIVGNQWNGLTLAGALPLLDVPAPSGGGVDDTIVGFTLACP